MYELYTTIPAVLVQEELVASIIEINKEICVSYSKCSLRLVPASQQDSYQKGIRLQMQCQICVHVSNAADSNPLIHSLNLL